MSLNLDAAASSDPPAQRHLEHGRTRICEALVVSASLVGLVSLGYFSLASPADSANEHDVSPRGEGRGLGNVDEGSWDESKNREFIGHDLGDALDDVDSLQVCLEHCRRTKGCRAVSWGSELAGKPARENKCFLKSWDFKPRELVNALGIWSANIFPPKMTKLGVYRGGLDKWDACRMSNCPEGGFWSSNGCADGMYDGEDVESLPLAICWAGGCLPGHFFDQQGRSWLQSYGYCTACADATKHQCQHDACEGDGFSWSGSKCRSADGRDTEDDWEVLPNSEGGFFGAVERFLWKIVLLVFVLELPLFAGMCYRHRQESGARALNGSGDT